MEEITLVPSHSLITDTPEEDRQLAVKIALLILKMTQPDATERDQLQNVCLCVGCHGANRCGTDRCD